MGIHTGNLVFVVMGSKERKEFTVMGDTVNTASRIMSIAEPGEVLVTKDLYIRCKNEFEFSSAGRVKVKGKKRKIEIYKLKGKKLSTVRTKFVDREKELKKLFTIIDKTYRTKENIKINLRGENKIGKTSLIIEAYKRYGKDFVFLRLQSFPYFNRIPLMPLISFIKYLSRNYKSVDEFLKTKKIKSIDVHNLPLILPSLVELLSPCIFLIENLELFDSASRKIIENLSFKKSRGIVFIIETNKLKLRGFQEIKLKPFDFEKLHDFLSVYLQKRFDSLLSSFIFEKTKGIPGFAISIIENLFRRKEVVLKKGVLNLKNPEKPPSVPDNILSFQLSILNEFDARKRDFLEKLAVADFPLRKSEFCNIFGGNNEKYFYYFERQGILKNLGDGRLYFQNFYFEKAIYEHILEKRKKVIHLRYGNFLEKKYSGQKEFNLLIGKHFYLAGKREKSIEFLYKGFESLRQQEAYEEMLEVGEILIKNIKDAERLQKIYLYMSIALSSKGEHNRALDYILKEEKLARKTGDLKMLARAYSHIADIYLSKGDTEKAEKILIKAIKTGKTLKEKHILIDTLMNRGVIEFQKGNLEEAEKKWMESFKIAKKHNEKISLIKIMTNLGILYFEQKNIRKSMLFLEKALKLAKK